MGKLSSQLAPKGQTKIVPSTIGPCNSLKKENENMIRHKKRHTVEKRFHCDFCDKAFTSPCHLARHNLIHTEERPHQCDKCDKSFAHSSTLIPSKHKTFVLCLQIILPNIWEILLNMFINIKTFGLKIISIMLLIIFLSLF